MRQKHSEGGQTLRKILLYMLNCYFIWKCTCVSICFELVAVNSKEKQKPCAKIAAPLNWVMAATTTCIIVIIAIIVNRHHRHRSLSLYSYSEDISIVVGELALTLLHPILPSPRVPGGWKKMKFNLLTYCQHLSMHSMQKILVRKIETFKNILNWFLWVFSKMFNIKII